jgi:host factor-I protein
MIASRTSRGQYPPVRKINSGERATLRRSPERTAQNMTKVLNLQDHILNQARKSGATVTVFLMNGFQMHGTVAGFDSFTVVLETDGKQQLIYKHAISTVVSPKSVPLPLGEEAG